MQGQQGEFLLPPMSWWEKKLFPILLCLLYSPSLLR
jgi:hypothetical protein